MAGVVENGDFSQICGQVHLDGGYKDGATITVNQASDGVFILMSLVT